jgi:hypothetical protein
LRTVCGWQSRRWAASSTDTQPGRERLVATARPSFHAGRIAVAKRKWPRKVEKIAKKFSPAEI